MVLAYLIFGMVFGASLCALTLLNGGGVMLALLAYSAGGTLAILLPFVLHAITDMIRANSDWKDDHTVSA